MTNPEGVIQALAVLTAAYHKELPRETLELYVKWLAHHPRDALMAAVQRIVALNKFFPTIAEINETVALVRDPFPAPTAEEAWAEVTATASTRGRSERPVWTYPAIKEAVDMIGGYRRICDSSTEYEGVIARDFRTAYHGIMSKKVASYAGLGTGSKLEIEA